MSLPEPVTPGLSRGHHSLPEPLSISMFASRGVSHANKIISFHCLLSKMPSLRKETQEVLWNGNAYCRNMQESGTAKTLRLLDAAVFANRGYRVKLRE